jgi:hypothetical protein
VEGFGVMCESGASFLCVHSSLILWLIILVFKNRETKKTCRGKIFSPWLGDVAESGMELSYRPASLCSLACQYDNSALLSYAAPYLSYDAP